MDSSSQHFTEKLKYSSEFAINFDERIIYIFGELESNIGTSLRLKYDLLKNWYKDILKEPIKDLNLDISSEGGSIYSITAALDFFDELKREGILVNTKAQGICMSAATVLLSGGTGNRTATKRTKFMLHDVQIEGVGGTANQVQHTSRIISEEQMEMFAYYAQFSRKGEKELEEKELIKEAKKWHKRFTKDGFDHYLSSQEILELKLIDSIL